MATAIPGTDWTWPPEVLALADEQGLAPYLEPVVAMTRQIFPGRPISVEATADYEIPDEALHHCLGGRDRLDGGPVGRRGGPMVRTTPPALFAGTGSWLLPWNGGEVEIFCCWPSAGKRTDGGRVALGG